MVVSSNYRHTLTTTLRISALAIALCAGTVLARQSTDVDWNAEGNAWWAHVQFLASDDLRGRDIGSDGYRRASEYVAKQFADAGLQPAGTNGFMQPVDFEVRRLDESNSNLSLERAGKTEALQLGPDATLRVNGDPSPSVKAQAVFVGYGFAVPEMGYNELADVDLQGKIAVLLSGGPDKYSRPAESALPIFGTALGSIAKGRSNRHRHYRQSEKFRYSVGTRFIRASATFDEYLPSRKHAQVARTSPPPSIPRKPINGSRIAATPLPNFWRSRTRASFCRNFL